MKDPIETTFQKLRNTVCWGVEDDPQLNLSMSFGRPKLIIDEPSCYEGKGDRLREMLSYRKATVRGSWWLWVYHAYWRISLGGFSAATTSSSLRKKKRAFALLSGQKVVAATVRPQTGATAIEFDLCGRLEIRRFEKASTKELWLLYEPSGYVLAVRGSGEYSYQPGDAEPKDQKWRRIT